MTTKELLIAARAKIAQGWCQGMDAADAQGNPVDWSSRKARQWCISGAMANACDGFHEGARAALLSAAKARSLVRWNDAQGRTQAQVLKLFDKAIKACHD